MDAHAFSKTLRSRSSAILRPFNEVRTMNDKTRTGTFLIIGVAWNHMTSLNVIWHDLTDVCNYHLSHKNESSVLNEIFNLRMGCNMAVIQAILAVLS